jgi:hypothetical protein
MGYWSVIDPEAATNLLKDPSLEYGTISTYWTQDVGGGSGTAVISGSASFKGPNSALLTPGSAGVILYQAVTTAAASHTLSCYAKRLDNGSVSATDLVPYIDGATAAWGTIAHVSNDWYRCSKAAVETAAAHNTGVKSLAGGTACYVDALQFEAAGYPTTYVDGTQPGCTWAGAKHASTSTRSAQERSGGRVIDIDATYGVTTRLWSGFGMPPVRHNVTDYAAIPGARLQSVKVLPRPLILTFALKGTSLANYHSKRKSLLDSFKPDLVYPLRPARLIYTGAGGDVALDVDYDAGLEGGIQPTNYEQIAARFIAYDPFWRETGEAAATLNRGDSLAVGYMAARVSGQWGNLGNPSMIDDGGGDGPECLALALGQDGTLYLGGDFLNLGGTAAADYIAKRDPITGAWSALGTGLNQSVWSIVQAPDGSMYVGGRFTGAGGVAGADYIARWDGSAWSRVGGVSDFNAIVRCLAFGPDGTLYAGGDFTNVAGVAAADGLAKWNGTAWTGLASLAGNVSAVAVGLDGTVYIGGTFTTAGGAPTDYLAKWNGSAWVSVGSDPNGSIYAIEVGSDGMVYAGGTFTTIGGVSANRIAAWNGAGWSALGSGCNDGVYLVTQLEDGSLLVSGLFTAAGGLTLADRIARWNGTVWTHLDIDLPGSPTVSGLLAHGADLYLGFDTSGTAFVSSVTTVTNSGQATTYPKCVIKRSGGTGGTVQWLKNETTGKVLYCNYGMLDGETLTIDFSPSAKSVVSDFFPSIIGRAVLPGSDFATWGLLPGDNDISLLITDAGTPTWTAYLQWQNQHWSPDGLAD